MEPILFQYYRRLIPIFCGVLLSGIAAAEPGAEDVLDIVRGAEQAAYFQGNDGRARVSMRIRDKNGNERRRTLTVLRRDGEVTGEQKYFVYLHYPEDVKNTVLMVWKRGTGDDDRWLYLPALDLVKRIAAGDKRTSFLGSDFYYEDVSGRSAEQDSHSLSETSDDYYVIDSQPKAPKSVEFSRYRMWIHRSSHIPVKVEFYDRQDRLHRVYEALEVGTVDGFPTVTISRIRDVQNGSETTLEFKRVAYNIGVEDEVFSERYLRTPPRKLLR